MTTTAGKSNRTWLLALIGVVLVAALLRGWAFLRLPLDNENHSPGPLSPSGRPPFSAAQRAAS